jgi:tape measure domain-containing protein
MAGTINLANVAIGFDVSKIQKGTEFSRAELRTLSGVVQDSVAPIDRYNHALNMLGKAHADGAITAERMAAAEASLAKRFGVETEAMIQQRKAAEALEKQKKDAEALDKLRMQSIQRGIELRKQVMTAEERHAAAIRQHSNDLKRGVIDQETYNRLIEQSIQKNGLAAKAVLQVADAHKKLSAASSPVAMPQQNQFSSDIKSTIAQYAGLAASAAALKKSLSLAATAETNKISLEVLTGSAQRAQMLYDGFVQLDRNSPLSRTEFAKAGQTIIGYGYAAESTLPALKALSEVSLGNAERFQSLSLAFGQVTAQGRLMGQEVLQMVNAGFNPLQEISRTTGRSMVELKKAMEDGAISASMVEDAFKSATSEGGRFYEMNERLKNSAAGQWAKIQSDVEMLATEIGTNLLPAAKAFMDLMTSGENKQGEKGFLSRLTETAAIGTEGLLYAVTFQQGKFDQMMERLVDERTKAEMMAGFHVNTPEETERLAKIMADRQRKERDELAAIAKREADEKERAAKIEKELIKEKERAVREAEQRRKREMDSLIRQAERLEEKTSTPMERYTRELDRLQKLIDMGGIDQTTFNRADKQLQAEAKKDMNPKNLSDVIAPALRAGSVEAYKFLLSQKSEEYELQVKQTELQERQLDVQERQLEALQSVESIGRAR